MRSVAIGQETLQSVSATGSTRHAQDTSIQLSFQTSVLLTTWARHYPRLASVRGTMKAQGGKTLFSQEVGAKLKRRVQCLRHSEFDLLQLCVCNCTRSPSGSATSVPPYKCTRFKDYFGFKFCDRFFQASLTPYLLTSVQVLKTMKEVPPRLPTSRTIPL